jgi:hypothetical protein
MTKMVCCIDRVFIARPPEQVFGARMVDQCRSPDPFNKRPEVLGPPYAVTNFRP